MTLNYVQDKSEILYKGQDVFLNITNDQAYDVGLIKRPTPSIVIKPNNPYKPVINKPVSISKKTSTQQFITEESDTTNDTSDTTPVAKSKIISQWVFKKDVKNSFYAGYCTWYAAIISPEIFPYTSENKQEREFGGNAREWCDNAKKA
jgi:surface antigen